tara:strand:- start:1804 stop:2400 length:597 start_codon:yes stop_codon:yes gene_type:complete
VEIETFIAMVWFIISVSFTPGPGNILSSAHGAQHGFKKTINLLFGLISGWALLGLFVGFSISYIQQYPIILETLTWICAGLIIRLAWILGTAKPIKSEDEETNNLGFVTGFFFSLVNGKAWVFHLTIMGGFAQEWGTSFFGITSLVGFYSIFGLAAISSWAYAGTLLKEIFNSEKNAKILNILFGISLVLVAAEIIIS